MIKQQYVMQFTTSTDYYQKFEISFDDFWEDYCKEADLQEIAWDFIIKNPDKYRVGEGDYDNESIINTYLHKI